MKFQFLLFGLLVAAAIFLYKRLLDTEEKLVLAEAQLGKLQRENAAIEQSFKEAYDDALQYDKAHPLPDDPDKKMQMAMLDAIFDARARESLGDNYREDEEDES